MLLLLLSKGYYYRRIAVLLVVKGGVGTVLFDAKPCERASAAAVAAVVYRNPGWYAKLAYTVLLLLLLLLLLICRKGYSRDPD